MAEPYCDHCDLPLAQCVHSLPPEKPYRPLASGPTITANIDAPCPGCPHPIVAGESRITHTTDDGWLHETCVDRPEDLFRDIL